jgi:hypothetical protein
MATPLPTEEPSLILKFPNDLTNLHDYTTVVRSRCQTKIKKCAFTFRFLSEAKTTEPVAHQDRRHCRMGRSVERLNAQHQSQVVLDASAHPSTRPERLPLNDLRPAGRQQGYHRQGSSSRRRDETQIRCRRHRTTRIRLRTTHDHSGTPVDPPTKTRPHWALPQRSSLLARSMTCQDANRIRTNLLETQPVHLSISASYDRTNSTRCS